jgi:hypothetical protein
MLNQAACDNFNITRRKSGAETRNLRRDFESIHTAFINLRSAGHSLDN